MIHNTTVRTIQEDVEYIVCSAIKYFRHPSEPLVVCGLRHNNCISTYYSLTGDQTHDEEQGFLTSTGRFVDREEAGKIALACGQVKELKYYNGKKLDSSDLYHSTPQLPSTIDKEPVSSDWISVSVELPNDSDGRVLCWCEEIGDLGKSSFFWNCSYSKRHGFTDTYRTYTVTHWKRITPPTTPLK